MATLFEHPVRALIACSELRAVGMTTFVHAFEHSMRLADLRGGIGRLAQRA